MLSISACGNVAADPRTNTVRDSDVTNFTLLVNKKVKGEDVTTAIDCAVWGTRAKVAADYIKKGSQVAVTGTGHAEVYEGRNGTGCKIVLSVTDFSLPPKPKADSNFDF